MVSNALTPHQLPTSEIPSFCGLNACFVVCAVFMRIRRLLMSLKGIDHKKQDAGKLHNHDDIETIIHCGRGKNHPKATEHGLLY
ncbi:hypothetical protein ACO22_01515, partial [Paracoccidioides brasiliensis]